MIESIQDPKSFKISHFDHIPFKFDLFSSFGRLIMQQKKVLIITYYWPPSGGGGVQRWLKFAKYLPEFGWEPIIFTPENPEFDLKDESLEKDVSHQLEVLRFPIWEPFGFYKRLFKKNEKLKQGIVIEKTKMSVADRISVWIRANLFIPDPRMFWVRPSVKFLKEFVKENQIETVVTTGPPHSMHLIGLGLKKKCQIKWVADFRDPWSDWDILDKLGVSSWARRIHKNKERAVLCRADLVLTVSKRLGDSLREKAKVNDLRVITNGVDSDDFDDKSAEEYTDKFRITHMGLLNEIRNPECLWSVLEELCQSELGFKDDLEIVLAGMVSTSILDRLNHSSTLANCINHLDYISHREVFSRYKGAAILLLLLNQTENAKWILPGKLFEYLMANRPILTLGERESDVQDILHDTGTGEVLAFDDQEGIKEMVLKTYKRYKSKNISLVSGRPDKYLRKNLTSDLANLLNEL